MILLSKKSDVFNIDKAALFGYVTNMENYINWFPGVISIQSKNALQHGEVGKQYSERLEFPEGLVNLTIEVKEAIDGMKFMTEGDLEPLLPRMEMAFFGEDEDRSNFTLSYHSRNPSLGEDVALLSLLQSDLTARSNEAFKKLHEKIKLGSIG